MKKNSACHSPKWIFRWQLNHRLKPKHCSGRLTKSLLKLLLLLKVSLKSCKSTTSAKLVSSRIQFYDNFCSWSTLMISHGMLHISVIDSPLVLGLQHFDINFVPFTSHALSRFNLLAQKILHKPKKWHYRFSLSWALDTLHFSAGQWCDMFS